MKKQNLKSLAFIAIAGSLITSCDLLKDLDYTVTPDPLEMHGDSVRVKVDIVFPEKGVHKKALAEIKPFIGSTALKTLTVQGEKATGNGTVIAKEGGKITYTDVVAYKPDMEASALSVTADVYKGDKLKDQLDTIDIADATIITPYLVNKDFKVIYAADNFQRVTEEKEFAQINYLKGKSNVRTTEWKDEDIKSISVWLDSAQNNPKISIKSIEIVGFASPEGEEDKNNTLSTDRAGSAKEVMMKIAKDVENEKAQTEIYNLTGSGEDYPGFKRELEESDFNEDEKNLILRVLEMYQDKTKREAEMRAMGKTFTKLDKEIFPLLRRAEINVVYDLTGYSDEELKAISVSNPDSLNLEELLFTATLTTDLNEKLRLYQVAAKNYPEDERATNNIGSVYFEQNKLSEAKSEFDKANAIKENSVSNNNLAAIAGVNGDRATAKELLSKASGAGEEVNYNMGILNIQDGDYASAVTNLGSEASFNKALAQLLNGDAAGAITTIDGSVDADSAQGHYLKAIAYKRQDKDSEAKSEIAKATAKDPSLGAKALKDREFITPVAIKKMAADSDKK